MVDPVDIVEKVVGLHAVLDHHAPQSGAVAPVEILLFAEGIVIAEPEKLSDVAADAPVDLLPQIEMMRIEGVVEVEHPGLDMREVARAPPSLLRLRGGSSEGGPPSLPRLSGRGREG